MDTLISNVRRVALELAVGGPCLISPGQETEVGEFNINFSTSKIAGRANIRISRIKGSYATVVSLRQTGQESACFWSYSFFEERGHYLPKNPIHRPKNNSG